MNDPGYYGGGTIISSMRMVFIAPLDFFFVFPGVTTFPVAMIPIILPVCAGWYAISII